MHDEIYDTDKISRYVAVEWVGGNDSEELLGDGVDFNTMGIKKAKMQYIYPLTSEFASLW